LAVLQNAAEFC